MGGIAVHAFCAKISPISSRATSRRFERWVELHMADMQQFAGACSGFS